MSNMILIFRVLSGLFLLGSVFFWIVSLLGAIKWKLSGKSITHSNIENATGITILKLLCGNDAYLSDNLESFCNQSYSKFQIIFGVLDPEDTAILAARKVQSRHKELDIVIVSGGKADGLNRKVANLCNMQKAARYDLYVLADSDMHVNPDYLKRISAPFTDPEVGLATCLYRGMKGQGIAAKLEALGIGANFAPGVFAAYLLEGLSFALGATIIIRRETLQAIGGFESIANVLADDYVMGNRVKANGKKLLITDYVVDDILGEITFREMWSRKLRWARTMRVMRPTGWLFSFISNAFFTCLVFTLSCGLSRSSMLAAITVYMLRIVIAILIAAFFTMDYNVLRFSYLLPLSDIMEISHWAGSFMGNTILWRNVKLHVDKNGTLRR
jgi:ceramide glucosyltransferase